MASASSPATGGAASRRRTSGTSGHVPLIVKRPDEHKGEIVDRNVRTTDILPTIADVIGETLPFRSDGRSLFDPANDRSEVSVHQRRATGLRIRGRGRAPTRRDGRAHGGALRRGTRTASTPSGRTGRSWARRRTRFPATDAGGLTATIDGEPLLHRSTSRRRSSRPTCQGASRARARGRACGSSSPSTGRSRASGRASTRTEGSPSPPTSPSRPSAGGEHRGDLRGERTASSRRSAAPAPARSTRWPDRRSRCPAASRSRSRPARRGAVEDWFFERDAVRFGGWAGDVETASARRPRARLRRRRARPLRHAGRSGRADLAKRYPGLGRSGFVFDLPQSLVGEGGDVALRFFARPRRNGDRADLRERDFPGDRMTGRPGRAGRRVGRRARRRHLVGHAPGAAGASAHAKRRARARRRARALLPRDARPRGTLAPDRPPGRRSTPAGPTPTG